MLVVDLSFVSIVIGAFGSCLIIELNFLAGIVVVPSRLTSHLILTDIYHNIEQNLNIEWNIVRASYFITFMFIVMSLTTIWRLKKT